MKKNLVFIIVLILIIACKKENKTKNNMEIESNNKGTFGYDAAFLKKHDKKLVILKSGAAKVIVSPKFQAKVFTSTADGNEGKSLGWINYKAFGKQNKHMNAYGGENRFWLGPEGGVFSLFFEPKTAMIFDNWKTPAPIDNESWDVIRVNGNSILLTKKMRLKNYSNVDFNMNVEREILILAENEIEKILKISSENLKVVGYKTKNSIENNGNFAWTETTGAPCIWILDMFPPSEKTTVVVPYNTDAEGKIATTDYFGQIPENRVTTNNGTLYFKADGKSRGKLGIGPKRANNIAGSYDGINKILTITLFDVDANATYLNQEWKLEGNPFVGDAINAYNDGPLDDGSQMGPFYEIESVSPAAFLKPNEKLTHNHTVFHFMGKLEQLNSISKRVLGVALEEINNAL
ncbi:DUF6786 family protein [uncultured Polaribacter sp.]|uniref:DUF6786 family protein n=1 Tax=uncultured Polaribacter sp. TaxID=174711 RepID=UPI00260E2F09|nr:DUF6786 family protein [uncultured Polaribacter sp.]